MQPHRIETHNDPHGLSRSIELKPQTFMSTSQLVALAHRLRGLADELNDLQQYTDSQDNELDSLEEQRDTATSKQAEAEAERDRMQDEMDEAISERDRLQNEYDALRELFDTCTS